MSSVAVLQARTSSSRLPGKVLLPVNGIPIAVLAAKRAGNTGRRVIVATSRESSDDGLAAIVTNNNLPIARGSLENALDRIVSALVGYADDTLVFRLTADNVLPDGRLLDEIEQDFLRRRLDYICCNGEPSGLPYGVSVELTRLKHLREALSNSADAHDQEHVTPYVIRKFGEQFFERYLNLGMGHFRATIDCIDDFYSIQKVFSGVADPICEDVLLLIKRLEGAPYQPSCGMPARRMVLGAAQLGFDYGIANRSGKPDRKIAEKLVKTAISNGVAYIDTARAYGVSEETVGAILKGWHGRAQIITKLSALSDCPQDQTEAGVKAFVDASVYQSCCCLRTVTLDVLLLHRASHLDDWGGSAWRRLKELRAAGVIKRLGVSVQDPIEAERALKDKDVAFIQMPFNILDWRWDDFIAQIIAVKKARDLTIHVRSALLQGLLTSQDPCLWSRANVAKPREISDWLLHQTQSFNRRSTTELCISYVNSQTWVDGVVIGVETLEQLEEDINFFGAPSLTPAQISDIVATRPPLSASSLNPSLWKKA